MGASGGGRQVHAEGGDCASFIHHALSQVEDTACHSYSDTGWPGG